MSRGILDATWGSRGASGALRGVEGLLELVEDTTRSGEIDGILVRRYDRDEEELDVADILSGGRSRFDSSMEAVHALKIRLSSDPGL